MWIGYYDRWQQIEIGQLTRELAIAAYFLARTAHVKFRAMYQEYRGLRIFREPALSEWIADVERGELAKVAIG